MREVAEESVSKVRQASENYLTTSKAVENFRVREGKTKARAVVSNGKLGGLALEARPDREAKRWIYRYRQGDKVAEYQLGSYPQMKLGEARQAHREAFELVKQGIDPRKHRKAIKAANQAAWTMGEAFEKWIDFYATAPVRGGTPPTERTVLKQKGRWRLHLAKRLGGAYVRDISRRQLIEVLEKIASTAREEARQCLTLLRQLLDYCEDREQINDNPAAGLKPAKVKARPGKPRDRHLKLPEMMELWEALDDCRNAEGVASTAMLSASVANAVRLLILTGARRAEVSSMRWAEVKKDTWHIHASRTKSAREHKVHLSKQALAILDEQRKSSGGEFVFESSRDAGKPIHYDTITTAIARLQGRSRKQHDTDAVLYHLEHFTVHDLRRSVATLWTETFMADPLLVDAMLAHVPPKLVGTYNKGKRYRMQVDIWEQWGAAIEHSAI
ncbi:site-specific integrase [Chromohalobacter sp. 296-RDG]|uniref:tyrosine-type recombinase/integrase n=1 Tax=Chromohalobacter sp. 296-RDG TaxID=2994062 RepID=UPI002468628C|nr:site-specific integrase [Chromohalobacter sp. 296-RDG]